ncbi:hypothetical protein [Mycobacterium syngnathidarum]|uniref:Uncharacterized protein n=1 Tax=Mycobacterium syngnathidarum TaxID=1908205 RepID=A0A1S1JUM3_9MYCO|nr:hypothetical protein [Mycobacterium syngnathidarum]OHT92250.1 hypothetical protein BKG61_24555 [Mycobacterium syngnathidarum]OLT94191.1 hypothetical protein BKG60_19635 [Mycobacterium syngnathidarum]
MSRRLMLVCAALASTMLAGCASGRDSEARSIGTTIRELPGVGAVEVDYDDSFTHGEHFNLDVELDAAATAQQAQDVVHTFVAAAGDVDFDSHYVVLHIGNDRGGVELRPLADDVGQTTAAVTLWFDTMSSPVVDRVAMTAGHPAIVTLRQPVDTLATEELVHRHPQLGTAQWLLQVPPAYPFESTSTYTSYGVIPDAATAQAWTEVVRIAGPHLVKGTFRPDPVTGVATSAIEISAKPGAEPRDYAIADPIAVVLARLGRPVDLTIKGGNSWVEVTIGGCFQHDKAHVPRPLETQLAQVYERC